MNSIFKFYNQVWTLLALAGAALIVRMGVEAWPGLVGTASGWYARSALAGIADRPIPHPSPVDRAVADAGRDRALAGGEVEAGQAVPRLDEPAAARWARAGLIASAVVIALSLFYPALAIRPRLEQRFTADLGSGTLNGFDWMEYGTIPTLPGPDGRVYALSFASDRAAIEWFWENVPGSPVVAEASIGPYRCNGSRISIGTGLPTIIGWERHQQQQRYPDELGRRVRDVATLYSSPDPATKLGIIRRYGVEYVVVGPLERLGIVADGNSCRPTDVAAGIAAFDAMVGTSLEVVFQHGETTVYRVLPEAATAADAGQTDRP